MAKIMKQMIGNDFNATVWNKDGKKTTTVKIK